MDNMEDGALAWTAPPEGEFRRLKTMMEDEMMIKLGAKKESIEFHPLILVQRAQRPNTSFELDYQRIKPPYREKQPATRSPWGNTDQAIRQMCNLSRKGPRRMQLPSLPPKKVVKQVYVPTEDEDFKKLRRVRLLKREEILAEWSALQHQAYTLRKISHLILPDIDPLRKYSSASLFSIHSATPTPREDSSPKKVQKTFAYLPATGKKKGRWRGMARQLLWNTKGSQMRLPEELPRSEIRIYISCTQDLSEEREFLAEVAYPELRKYCEKQGLSCHVVDLRHGTNRLKNDRETFDVIQSELSKCQKRSIGPCFVSLVGQEADDTELPGWLSTEDMLAIRSVLVKLDNIPAVETLDNLYRLDSNYRPAIYLLQEEYFFVETAETALLHQALPEALAQLHQDKKLPHEPGYYRWSSTIKEIQTGLLTCLEPKRQTVCLMARAAAGRQDTRLSKKRRSIPSSASSSLPDEYTASTGDEGADTLRAAIVDCYNHMGSKNNLILFNVSKKTLAYLREVCTLFISAVTGLIDSQIMHHEFDVGHHMTHAADLVTHVRIGRQVCSNFLGGEDVVNHVSELIGNLAYSKPVVVIGPEGCGKTALSSVIAFSLPRADPLRKIAFRILGLTLSSSSLFHLMTSLYHQVAFIYDTDPFLPPDLTLPTALQYFRELLFDVRDKILSKGPLTIVLDGIDKVPDMIPKHLSFLMGSMPQGVTLVISMLDSGPLFDTVKSVGGAELINCPGFVSKRSGTYVESFLAKRDKVLTNDQMRAILGELHDENVPLLARIAASMAVRWPSHTLNDDMDISNEMESAFHRLLESCEVQLGQKFTRYVLSLLTASRYGLADFEILHIIATDTELIDEIKEEADDVSVLEGFPYQMQLCRLLWRLEPFIYEVKTEGETLLTIHHETLRYVVRERFMSDSFKYHIHSRLATFFQFTRRGNLLNSKDIVEGKHKDLSRYLWRTLRSVPYHLCHSHEDPEEVWKRLKATVFMKFSWIINEIYAGFFCDFINDMNYALETLCLDSGILFLRQFMISSRQTIIFNPVSLASLLAGQDMKEMAEIQKSVQEAQEWLKNVHLQVLVPTSYTAPKASHLQLNNALAQSVRSIISDSLGERVFLQYDANITYLDHSTVEEAPLVALTQPIISVHQWGPDMLTVVTSTTNNTLVLDTYAVDKGRHIKTVRLQDKAISWLHVRSDGCAFYASGTSVKKVQLEKGSVTQVFTVKEETVDACVSNGRHCKVVTLHITSRTLLRIFDSRHPEASRSMELQKNVVPERYKPLHMTKDSLYVVVVCDRSMVVVDITMDRMACSCDFNNVPVTLTAFSRSHEHIFVVTATNVIRCYKLSVGTKVMETDIKKKPKSKKMAVSPLPKDRNSVSNANSKIPADLPQVKSRGAIAGKEQEDVTALVTSEDDHFLLVGTNRGQMYTIHVPTGVQVAAINSGQASLKDIVYFTNVSWFQSVATLDTGGWVKMWNLTPLITRARTLIMGIITDKDLLEEEKAKMDLALYFTHFQQRRNDRMFLNGPDVSAFYQQMLNADLFSPVQDLDPSLTSPLCWTDTGRMADCTRVCSLATGTELSDVLVTATTDGDVAWWSLQDGSLLTLRPCPVLFEKEEEVDESVESKEEEDELVVNLLRTVYYDQALLVVLTQGTRRRNTVAVQYAEDTKKRSLVRKDVIATYVSTSSTLVVHVLCGDKAELILVFWNLVTAEEQHRMVLSTDTSISQHVSTMTFSNDLTLCAMVVPRGEENYALCVWRLTLDANQLADDGEDESALSSRGSEEALLDLDSDNTSSLAGEQPKDFRELLLLTEPTAVGFALNAAILIATSSGHVVMVAIDTLHVTSALTTEGVVGVTNQPVASAGTWNRFPAAHVSAINSITCASDSHVIVTCCDNVLCVWNLLQKRLLVRVVLEGEEFTHYVLSRDCRVLTYSTSGSVLAVWGVKEGRQLCAFRLHCPATELAASPDCRRLVVLLNDGLTSQIRVFDVRNIDDIKVERENRVNGKKNSVESRKHSSDEEDIPD